MKIIVGRRGNGKSFEEVRKFIESIIKEENDIFVPLDIYTNTIMKFEKGIYIEKGLVKIKDRIYKKYSKIEVINQGPTIDSIIFDEFINHIPRLD